MTGEGRDIRALPKAHLHLHFTGAMRHATLLELAHRHGVRLPDALVSAEPPELHATDERGWFRFQRLYDTARSVLQEPEDLFRLVREVAEDELADGSQWLEIQVDPSGYASRFDGLTATFELMLDAVRAATAATGLNIGVIVGANRTRHPLDARTLARLAIRYVDDGVVGFGLANDERRGRPEAFEDAFRIAREGGLASLPHGGELSGPSRSRVVWMRCTQREWDTESGASRTRHSSSESPQVGWRLKSVPLRMSRLASMTSRRTCRFDCLSMLVFAWRLAPTTRCCLARDLPTSTRSRDRYMVSMTRDSQHWHAHRSKHHLLRTTTSNN